MRIFLKLSFLLLLTTSLFPGETTYPEDPMVIKFESGKPLWKNGASYRIGKLEILEIGTFQEWEYLVTQDKVFFHLAKDRVNWPLGLELLASGKDDDGSHNAEMRLEKANEGGVGGLLAPAKKAWHLIRNIDPMSDEVDFVVTIDQWQTPTSLLMKDKLSFQFGQQTEPLAVHFNHEGKVTAIKVGGTDGHGKGPRQLRVDKNKPYAIAKLPERELGSVLRQMLVGDKLLTRYYLNNNNQGTPVLTKMDLKGFQLAHDYLQWWIQTNEKP